MLPIIPAAFMPAVGATAIAVGLAILAGLAQLDGYVAALWLLAIAVNLVTTGSYFGVAVRDVLMAIGAFTPARLTEAGVHARATERVPQRSHVAPAHA